MEAIGGGANVLAFIGLALKSTEAIYKTVSGLKDAPYKVQRLLSAVDDLRSILKQLSTLLAPPTAAQSFDDFESAIQKCNEDVTSLSKKLSVLYKAAGDGKWKSAWKRIRTVLEREDMLEMWTTVHHHVTVLGVYLGLLQSFSVARQTQSVAALEQAVQTNATHVSSNTQILEAQANSISSLDGHLQLFASHSSAAQQTAEQALGVLGQKIDAMPSLSENQFDIIKNMLEQLSIQQREKTIIEQRSTSSQSYSTVSGSDDDSNSNTYSRSSASSICSPALKARSPDILSSIQRLCRLVDAKEKTFGSSEAMGIIEDLEVLLNSVQHGPASITGGKRKRDVETAVEKSDIKRTKGLLTSTYQVKVNNEKRMFRVQDSTKSVDKRSSEAVTTKDGTMLLRTRTRCHNDATIDESILEFAASLTFMSSRPELRMKLSACFCQRMLSGGGYLVIPPMLSIHVTVPDDSDVFGLIKNDNLRGVVELLEQGRASLRDCDTKGRSLLSYASYAKSADICRFLVERGADVDALEVLISDAYGEDWESLVPPLMQTTWSTCSDRSPHDCRRVLIDAGADLQLQGKGAGILGLTTPLVFSLKTDSNNLLPLLDLSHELVDIEQRNHSGQTALMSFISEQHLSLKDFVAGLRCLKILGADFNAKDRNGRTALHIYVNRAWRIGNIHRWYRKITEELRELITNGADVDAVNADNETAIEESWRVGSMQGQPATVKLWREVLESTGHDPRQHKVLMDAFPDLEPNADTSTTHLDEPGVSSSNSTPEYMTMDNDNGFFSDDYGSDGGETEDSASESSESSLDPDPSSPAEARTSEPSAPTPAARVRAPTSTFWNAIDYAIEEAGNPWA